MPENAITAPEDILYSDELFDALPSSLADHTENIADEEKATFIGHVNSAMYQAEFPQLEVYCHENWTNEDFFKAEG